MKTHTMKTFRYLICAAWLLLPALQRAGETAIENQIGEPTGAPISVANPNTIDSSGTASLITSASNAGQDAIFQAGVPSLDDVTLLVLDGDNQSAPAGSFNQNPFDIEHFK